MTNDNKKDVSNLTSAQEDDWSIFLPALSTFYFNSLWSIVHDSTNHTKVANRLDLSRFEHGWKGIDFHNGTPSNSYFQYEWGLYSSGHAQIDPSKPNAVRDSMAFKKTNPDGTRKGVLLSDSSGFQAAQSAGKFKKMKPTDFLVPTAEATKLRDQILQWMETNSDYAMTLDIPAPTAVAPLNIKSGLTSVQQCLDISLVNLDYFAKNRAKRSEGKAKFLNVLSAVDEITSSNWYESVKGFSDPVWLKNNGYDNDEFEGYAFAGSNMGSMPSVLKRFADLIDDNLLVDKEWIHFLGLGRLNWACYLTMIQRRLRGNGFAPKITLSFDAASSFLSASKGLIYTNSSYSNQRVGFNMVPGPDSRDLSKNTTRIPFRSPVADRMQLNDICVYDHGETNKEGKLTKTSWDTGSYLLVGAHNTYNHIQSIQEAQRIMDYELAINPTLHYKNWRAKKKTSVANEVSKSIPSDILFFDSFAEEFFSPNMNKVDRYQLVEDNIAFLESISFRGKSANHFSSLFSFDTEEEAETTLFEDERY